MTRRFVLVIVLLGSLGSCGFAVKHPAITAGIVAGSVALGSCELASADQKSCFVISGSVGVSLAVVTAVALWLGYEDADPVPVEPGGDPTNLAPAPVFVPTPDQGPPVTKPPPEPRPQPPADPVPADPPPAPSDPPPATPTPTP